MGVRQTKFGGGDYECLQGLALLCLKRKVRFDGGMCVCGDGEREEMNNASWVGKDEEV